MVFIEYKMIFFCLLAKKSIMNQLYSVLLILSLRLTNVTHVDKMEFSVLKERCCRLTAKSNEHLYTSPLRN